MTIGCHAPLAPARTGVADYAAALARELGRHAEIRLNPSRPCDVELYHLGNNHLHREIYRRALERPGVAVLHDAVLQHFFLGSLDLRGYVEEFVYNYGEWHRDLARRLWQGRARSAQDPRYFRYPMLRRIAERSLAVVVHNPAAARMVAAHAPEARIVEIPHLHLPLPPPDPVEVTRLRRRLGVAPHAVLFGVFGYLRPSKRLHVVLRAFAAARREAPECVLLVAGRFESDELERALAPWLEEPGVHCAGFLPFEEFALHAAAVDVCLNLRYPPAGETSGIAIRLMGMGKPVVLTAGEETARFPEEACVRVDPGPAEEAMLARFMLWLARDAGARQRIGALAAAHIAREHDPARCAARYLEVLQAAARVSTGAAAG